MSRILIIDDDPNQLRLLARALAARDRRFTVDTALDGREAVRVLETSEIDVVLTDLQMPEINGFELLAWLISKQPHVTVFAMTAYPDAEAMARLRDLGSVECFTKPLDVAVVHQRLNHALRDGVRGHVQNISLASLLQLVEMERKTCTLSVESEGRTGHLFIEEGELVHAIFDGAEGEDVAIQIAGWRSPSIAISSTCRYLRRTVTKSMGFIVMESMRLLDEHADLSLPEVDDLAFDLSHSPDSRPPSAPPTSASPSGHPQRKLSEYPGSTPGSCDAMAVVDLDTGCARMQTGDLESLDDLVTLTTHVYRGKLATLDRLQLGDTIEELVVTTARYWVVARPLDTMAGHVVMLVFDPSRVNATLRRMELDEIIPSIQSWVDLGLEKDVPITRSRE